MNVINELELRNLLKARLTPQQLVSELLRAILDNTLSWEEKRGYWIYLYLSGRRSMTAHALKDAFQAKSKIPFDIFLEMMDQAGIKPQGMVLEALYKGLKKQTAAEFLFAAQGWDKWDKRLALMRGELVEQKSSEQKQFKENMVDKFWFLHSQRMTEQAARLLRRMIELFPEDQSFQKIKADYEEQWARDVLANHMANFNTEGYEPTATAPSSADQNMLNCFLHEGEKQIVDNRDRATELAMAFLFMDDYTHALEALAWAPPTAANDWLRAELLLLSRRFVEALELLNHLEVKYIDDPESTFAISYMRAQALKELGQDSSALEILQSIVRVRPSYRSAHALILEWSEGVAWE